MTRGLRACGPQHLTALAALRQEFERIGAMHLAERIGTLVTAIKGDDRTAAAALLRAQTSLRVFERLLTVQTMREAGLSPTVEEEETEVTGKVGRAIDQFPPPGSELEPGDAVTIVVGKQAQAEPEAEE